MAIERSAPTYVFVGTYTWMQPFPRGRADGIYVFRMNPATGNLTLVHTEPGVLNPTYLTVDAPHQFVYAVNAVAEMDGVPGGGLNAFAIDQKTGGLTWLNRQSTRGNGPCFVAVDRSRRLALTSNYHGGSIAALPIDSEGRLAPASTFVQHEGSSVNKDRQAGPHAHSINYSPDERFALVCDLGLDRVLVYRADLASGRLTPNDPPGASSPPGHGPRHLAFHPNGRFAFVINELGGSMTSFGYDGQRGALQEIETVSTLPADYHGENGCADVHVSPDGRFVYGSNRGHDSLVIYAVDASTGRLTYVGHQSTMGRTPRNFVIDPSGRLLLAANQDTDNIVIFQIDQQNGTLTQTGEVHCASPVCLKIATMG